MSNREATRPVVKISIEDLKDHPRQSEAFGDLSSDRIQELAADLKQNGQRTPIEVTPDQIIICGHQRVRAAKMLGWKQINAVVREDLAEEGAAAVFERLLNDNLRRRQLDPLAQARCYKLLKDNASKLPYERRKEYQGQDLRDRLGKEFNMSGRNLDRLVRILSTPLEVQHAVSANRLSLKSAGQVAGAATELQKKIAAEIKAGGDPEEVVKKHAPKPPAKQITSCDAVAIFLRHLEADVPDMEARVKELKPFRQRDVEILKSASTLIERLLNEVEVKEPTASPGSQEAPRTMR